MAKRVVRALTTISKIGNTGRFTTIASVVRSNFTIAAVSMIALAAAGGAARADVNLVTNGDFESVAIAGESAEIGFLASLGGSATGQNVTGWTSTGYNFVYVAPNGNVTGEIDQLGNTKYLWGPNGVANGLTSSPTGGNYVGADGDSTSGYVGPISQTINGLTPGDTYNLSFWWAGAQQYPATGSNTEQWQVSLGGQTEDTPVVDNTSGGFTGWMQETMTFTATDTSELLSFLSNGTPASLPPFALLDGVTLTVPEPASLGLMVAGLTGLAGVARRRRKPKAG